MSHDIELIDTTASGHYVTVHEVNFTYNYSPALAEAGLRWDDCDGRTGSDLAPLIRDTHDRIAADPEKYRPLIGGGGEWGTPELLIPKLDALAEACQHHYAARFTRH